ncbi:MAG TPA: adenosylhomocysteinase [Candidatus Ratteibacteria bacterium]|nr:adenosylhomocysteinase [bacterium]HON04956.1 adenosylhomocysteinase [bacterium]HPC28720.1 adenosylhomocysteinase [bacterium]HRS06034.1 adenosylhomocysteinase [Candidatus Ratteibacteria bacterium]HRV03515.1 adenosylhomocysteinase [Candidatus Ratteibacteria bacterium]
MDCDIKDIGLSYEGERRIEWALREMPVIRTIRVQESKNLFKNLVIGACLHITTETANLVITLEKCGARVFLTASNPLSTQDDVAACLVKKHGISVFGIKGEDSATYARHIRQVAEKKPHLVIDDGADLIVFLHNNPELAGNVIGATEETTTGITRIKNIEKEGKLLFPVIGVNQAQTKYMFDNRYGTGQSTIDGILRATNILVAGKTIVVCGYGWCGRGIAKNLKGLGANVIITEVSPLRALEALMDGFQVMQVEMAASFGDIFITATGNAKVIDGNVFKKMKDGAILANAGHFNVEIDVEELRKQSKKTRQVRDFVTEYMMENGKKIYLLAEGRLVNLGCAEGHPSAVMDMSFAGQFLSIKYLVENKMSVGYTPVPSEIDNKIASLKLESIGIKIDRLSSYQKKYLTSWNL